MQRLRHPEGLPSDGHLTVQVGVGEPAERVQQDSPAAFPVGEQLVLGDGTAGELLLPMAPWLLAVGGEKVGEAGAEVARQVPAEHGDAVTVPGARDDQVGVAQLGDSTFRDPLVAQVFVLHRRDDLRHPDISWERA